MRVRFVYRRGVEDEIAKERPTLEGLQDAADRVVEAAKGIAPVATGRYRSSITSRIDGEAALAYAAVPYAAYVEWGTSRGSPDQHPLARAVETVTRQS